ncbi:hypothetical protein evm_001024 [Chilo suppressalis]|nr:hypothetical protein evm_001024 [Chilo suppressalis]
MTYAFIVVVSVAITLKLLFLSFSMYFTFKTKENQAQTSDRGRTTDRKKSMVMPWRYINQIFLRKTLHFHPEPNKPNYTNKI